MKSTCFLILLCNFVCVLGDISLNEFNPETIVEDPDEILNKTYSEEQSNLQKHIFKDYNRRMRPLKNQSLAITVKAHVYLMHFTLDEAQQTLLLNGHIYLTWMDEMATWDPAEFNNIRYTMAKQWELWQPDLKVANSVAGANQIFEISRRSHASLESQTTTTTKVQIYPTFLMKIGCSFDYSNYPYDVQKCALRMYPMLRMNEVVFEVYYELSPSILLGWGEEAETKHIGEWKLTDSTSNVTFFRRRKFENKPPENAFEAARTWSILMVYFTFERSATLFWVTMGLPALVASIFNILSFLLPKPEHGLMITIGNMFIQVIFLQDVIKQLPPAVGRSPPIVRFADGLLILTVVAMIAHLLNKQFLKRQTKVPQKYVNYVYALKTAQKGQESSAEGPNNGDEETGNASAAAGDQNGKQIDRDTASSSGHSDGNSKTTFLVVNVLRTFFFLVYSVVTIVLIALFLW